MANTTGFRAVPINVPTLAEIADFYQDAVAAKNSALIQAAEKAVERLAAAEAAAAESATLVSFASMVKK